MSEWQTKVNFRRTPWRWVRDFFDTTSYLHQAKLLRKRQKQEKKVIIPEVVVESFLKQKEIPYMMNPADKNAVIIPEPPPMPPKRIINEDVHLIKKPYFVPVTIKKYKFEVERKIIKIKLPKIKFSMPALKRILYVTGIVTFVVMTFITVIVGARIIGLTEGDFIGEAYRYKINKFEYEVVLPLRAEIEQMKGDIVTLQAKKEFKTFEEMTGYRPPKPKVIVINKYYKNRKAPITETISK